MRPFLNPEPLPRQTPHPLPSPHWLDWHPSPTLSQALSPLLALPSPHDSLAHPSSAFGLGPSKISRKLPDALRCSSQHRTFCDLLVSSSGAGCEPQGGTQGLLGGIAQSGSAEGNHSLFSHSCNGDALLLEVCLGPQRTDFQGYRHTPAQIHFRKGYTGRVPAV